MVKLSLEHAYQVADRICPSHRADVLLENDDVRAWAREKVEKSDLAWAYVKGRAQFIGGIQPGGIFGVGVMWLAGVEGWTRYVKHAIRVAREILASGVYRQYVCEVHEADPVARRFAEHLGFREVRVKDGLVLYEVTP